MAKTIVFINEKGGIGKTSSCFNAAWEMSNQGKRILMIDMDGQSANLTFFCGVQKTEDTATIFHVLMAGKTIKETAVKVKDGLYLVPATTIVAGISQEARLIKLKNAIKEVSDDFDYIFIDVNPNPNWTHFLALGTADYCIIPMLPDIASLEANIGIADSIAEVKEVANPNLKVMGLLFNQNNTTTNLSKEVHEQASRMAQKLNTKVFKAKIRKAVTLSENVMTHVGITDYDPTSKAANDFRDFVQEIYEEAK